MLDSKLASMYIIDQVTGCWNWTGARNGGGYGQVTTRTSATKSGLSSAKAHRLFYEALRGHIPAGLVIDHLCRNTSCVNPAHLEPVITAVNTRRGKSTRLTERQVSAIRSRYANGDISQKQLGELYGVSESITRNIIIGKWWIAGIEHPLLTPKSKQGVRPKLAKAQVDAICAERNAAGDSYSQLAKRWNVSVSLICLVINGKHTTQKENR